MPRLSAVVIARDDAHLLRSALSSVSFADEVLVLDSGTTGEVERVCAPFGARVVKTAVSGSGSSIRWAAAQATNDWILWLRENEVATPELAAAVRELLASGEPHSPVHRARDVKVFMGRPLSRGRIFRHSSVRLFDRRRFQWGGPGAQSAAAAGEVGLLSGMVLHFEVPDAASAIADMNARSSVEAIEVALSGVALGGFAILFTAVLKFLRTFVGFGNFRNGFAGLAWSFIDAVGSATTHLKARELVAGEDSARRRVGDRRSAFRSVGVQDLRDSHGRDLRKR